MRSLRFLDFSCGWLVSSVFQYSWIKMGVFLLCVCLSVPLVAAAPTSLDMELFNTPPTDPCVNNSRAVKCVPSFENVAFNKQVEVSSTCGSPISTHCMPLSNGNELRNCFVCDSHNPRRQHPASFLTDLNNPNNETCWVSESGMDHSKNATLKLSLGKKYEITYMSLQFCSVIPDSMAIYKSKDYGKTWTPFQYYSSDCRTVYNKSPTAVVTKANEQEALCSHDYSIVTQGSGSRVAFSTLKDRPSSYHFEDSPVLQDWVTATDIMVVFNRLTPTPLTATGNSESLRNELFYSVTDFAVGARCKCNGHASECSSNEQGQLACDCKHNTEGAECEKCKPFHVDKPWERATGNNANECVGK